MDIIKSANILPSTQFLHTAPTAIQQQPYTTVGIGAGYKLQQQQQQGVQLAEV